MTKVTTRILNAAIADKYDLYFRAFQSPIPDVTFCAGIFRRYARRSPVSIREDFCGTAAVSCEWIRRTEDRHAIAVDIDSKPLAWCRDHLLPTLPPGMRERMQLIQGDVLAAGDPATDIILALNSSFCTFKERCRLLTYLHNCHDSLAHDGILVLGLYAGPEAQMTGRDVIQCAGFVAVWEQAKFNAVTNEALNRVHFEFPDGSSIRDAFEFDYRIWTPRELADALLESGFRDARVYDRRTFPGANDCFQECKHARVSTYWDVWVVGFKGDV